MTDRSNPLILAHRGVSVEFPENTIGAFAAATTRGADGVELDVRRSADGHLIVHHDAHLADGTAIVELRSSELPGEVPSLAEALDACADMQVNIEIKNFPGEPDFDGAGAVATGTVEVVRARHMVDQVIVSGFNYEDIQCVRHLDPDIPTGWLVLGVDAVETLLTHLIDHGHQALHPPVELTTTAVIAAAHRRGILVNTWTVDDPDRIVELAEAGVDAIITNDPVTARQALDRRRPEV